MKKLLFLSMMFLMAIAIASCDKDSTGTGTSGGGSVITPAGDSVITPAGYVDLGLQSGTLWKDENENVFCDYDDAVSMFGSKLPTKKQWEELKAFCEWTWTGNGYKVTGENGNSIVLPAAGDRDCNGYVSDDVGSWGFYWSSTHFGSDDAWCLYFYSGGVYVGYDFRCFGRSVRLVQD